MTAVLAGEWNGETSLTVLETGADMLYYPQLTTGAVSQFPVTRSTNMRTVSNQLASGYTIRMEDTGAQKVQWQLRYSSLTDGRAVFHREPV